MNLMIACHLIHTVRCQILVLPVAMTAVSLMQGWAERGHALGVVENDALALLSKEAVSPLLTPFAEVLAFDQRGQCNTQ